MPSSARDYASDARNLSKLETRSSEFMQTEVMQFLQWMRVIGDTVFADGGGAAGDTDRDVKRPHWQLPYHWGALVLKGEWR
jgi:hypothetical protein